MDNFDERLRRLRQEHSETLSHDGVEWRYVAVGEGGTGLLLLPGMAGSGEAYLRLVPELEDRFRMVMIRYPVVESLDQLLGGLAAVLDREGIDESALVGGSFGGLVAQAFLQRFPRRTGKVVLSATGAAEPERAASNEKWLRRLRFIPASVIRALLRLVVVKMLRSVTSELDFWRRFYSEAVGELTKADLASRYRISIDFDRRGPASPEDLEDWGGELLILEGSEDPVAKPEIRRAMQEIYPRATFHVFEGAGHGVSLERPDEWSRVVRGFLAPNPG